VPSITLEILNDAGNVETVACTDESPADGRWACGFDAGGEVDGATLQVRARATDIFGQTGEWTVWNTYDVDTVAPEFSVSDIAQILGPGIHHLTGALTDERQTGIIRVCREDGECIDHAIIPQPDIPPGAVSDNGIWTSYLLEPTGLEVDGQEVVLKIYGLDAAGNRTDPVTVTYTLDNKPPELNVTYLAGFIPAQSTHIIASGTVTDGTNVDVNVLVDPPLGSRQRLKAVVNGDGWEFIHGWTETGHYTLWVQAIDAAGNTTTIGPFIIMVGEANRVYFPFVFKNGALGPRTLEKPLTDPKTILSANIGP
jgi:hypothetical protein